MSPLFLKRPLWQGSQGFLRLLPGRTLCTRSILPRHFVPDRTTTVVTPATNKAQWQSKRAALKQGRSKRCFLINNRTSFCFCVCWEKKQKTAESHLHRCPASNAS
eukprot:m.236500 g.236500  ORF g.236500 m.236500 type:complete len:105 (-) comp18940_c0_seq2:725-1039(-)